MTWGNMPDWGNDTKRVAWIKTYSELGYWLPYAVTPEFDLNWYRCDLPDGTRIVVCERPTNYDSKRREAVYYMLKQPDDALLIECSAGLNAVADKLKELNQLRKAADRRVHGDQTER